MNNIYRCKNSKDVIFCFPNDILDESKNVISTIYTEKDVILIQLSKCPIFTKNNSALFKIKIKNTEYDLHVKKNNNSNIPFDYHIQIKSLTNNKYTIETPFIYLQ